MTNSNHNRLGSTTSSFCEELLKLRNVKGVHTFYQN